MLALSCMALGPQFACSKGVVKPAPAVAPEQTRAEAKPAAEEKVDVVAETFADVQILRLRVPSFDRLTKQQKLLAYYLAQAALSGRDITYDQKYAHNLLIKRTLEALVQNDALDRRTSAFRALETYLKRVWLANGIHHHDSSKKMTPDGLTRQALAEMIAQTDAARLPLREGESKETLSAKVLAILFDDTIAPKGVNRDTNTDAVSSSSDNFYVGLTEEDARAYVKQRAIADDPTPISVGLNSQLVRTKDGIEERVWRDGGMYGAALSACVEWLQKAMEVAETPKQREVLSRLVTFYRTGSLEDWDRYSVAWVSDTSGQLDLIHGFIETYGDPMGMRGTYEALVQIEDGDATQRVRTLSDHAQWFEDHLPIDDTLKKPNVVGVSARVIDALVGAGDASPQLPRGVNLPNASWIRQHHGSKSIIVGNVLSAVALAQRDNGELVEFTSSHRELENARAHLPIAVGLMVDMHEVIGHASGRLAPGVALAKETLGPYANTIEEARAELVALYFMLDPQVVTLELAPSLAVGRAAYDAFVRDALLLQLARVEPDDELEKADMRSRHLIASWAFEQGAGDGVIEKISRDGKTYFAVRDYVRLQKLFATLLREVQRIHSHGDLAAAKALVERYGVRADPELHREVRLRHASLGIAPYVGFIQPELTPVYDDEQIVDVKITYPDDFATQQLRYARAYSLLPTTN